MWTLPAGIGQLISFDFRFFVATKKIACAIVEMRFGSNSTLAVLVGILRR